jgi:hypothetical protein
MKRFSIVLSWLVLAIVLAGAQPALAQSPTCRGPSCNGLDPQETNCSADAQTPSDPTSAVPIYDNTGQAVGRVDVRYSPTCQAAFARARLTDAQYCPGQLLAQITRGGDFVFFTKVDFVFPNNNGVCVLRSPMIYAPSPSLVSATGGIFSRFASSTALIDPRR